MSFSGYLLSATFISDSTSWIPITLSISHILLELSHLQLQGSFKIQVHSPAHYSPQFHPPPTPENGLPRTLHRLSRKRLYETTRTNHFSLLSRMQQHALPQGRPHDQQTHVRLPHLPVQRRGAIELRIPEQHVQHGGGDGGRDAGCGQ